MLGTAAVALAVPAFAQNETVTVTGTSIRGQQPVGANVISVDRAAIESTGAQTTQQLLSTIPQLSDFGSSAQGNLNTGGRGNSGPDGAGNQTPTIHSLGSSTSTSTLILLDGHRLPNTGLTHNLLDASIIPPSALQNVEVLPDGASAIYGSDAVAGVINFHTRKDYTGWETTTQFGFAENYMAFSAGQLFGHSWENGGVVAAYQYSSRARLMNADRDFITARQDLRLGATDPLNLITPDASGALPTAALATTNKNLPAGQPLYSYGGNFQNFTSCPTAVIATASGSSVAAFVYPYAAGNLVHRQATGDNVNGPSASSGGPGVGICDTNNLGTSLPSELRNQGIVSIHQALTDRLQATVDLVYSSRLGSSRAARGGVSNITVWGGTGSGPAFGSNQRNPFFVPVPGSAGTSQFVSIGLDELLADQGNRGAASTKTGQITQLATAGLDYDLGGDWLASFGGTVGQDFSFSRSQGSLNTDEATLALNGTTNANGAGATTAASSIITDPYGLSTVVNVTRALTTANSLDVWRPAGATNRTSQSVLRSLVDSATTQVSIQQMQTAALKLDGPIAEIFGAGAVKTAFGGEYIHYTWNQRFTRAGTGPQSTGARYTNLNYERSVYAAFAEIVVPLINADMEIPLVRGLTFDFAGRWDHYSDFGDTKNPKISFQWDIIDGIRTSASMGSSFTAPPLGAIGAAGTGISGETNVGTSTTPNNLFIPFNDTRPFNAGAGIAGTFVSSVASCSAAGSTPSKLNATGSVVDATAPGFTDATGCKIVTNAGNSQGLSVAGGNASLKPQIGATYSVNLLVDFGRLFDPLEGLNLQVTYYQARINGLITNVNIQTSSNNAGIPQLTTFGPAVGTGGLPGWAPTDQIIQDFVRGRPLNNPIPDRIYFLGTSQVQNALNLWQNGLDFSATYRYSTDNYGDFTLNTNGNIILRFSQQNAGGAAPFNIKNGANGGRFIGQAITGSIGLDWRMAPYSLGVRYSYQSPYTDAVTTFPFNLAGPGRLANNQHISAFQFWNLSAGYDIPDDWISGSSINLNIQDLFNAYGPYKNQASGLAGGNALGRTFQVSLRKKW
jgi:iron complex outermembrane receptor protein